MACEKTKDRLEQAVLDLCEKKHLSKISVTDVLKQSGVTKSSFYSNFRDINDLYHYIYWEKVAAASWPGLNKSYDDYYNVCIINAKKIKNRYGKFFLQAIESRGQNCLWDFIMEHSVQFEFQMAKDFYEESQYDQLKYACEFYAYGWINARCEWIRSGYKTPVSAFAKQICDSRFAMLTWFMFDIEKTKQFMECSDLAVIRGTSFREIF